METESGGMAGADRNTGDAFGATSNIQRSTFNVQRLWLDVFILVLAAVLRLTLLDIKPAHFDEGVNGYFVDQMTRNGLYQYDPTNFHGPLHFYILFATQTLLGREEWAQRLPLALASFGCVAFLLYGYRRWFSATAARFAALAMAVSPGFVFYGRYAIHETWLVLFLMLLVAGLAGMWCDGRKRDLWFTGIGLAGIMLTKETWIIHVVALGLAWGTLWGIEKVWPSANDLPLAVRREATGDDILRVGTICFAFVLFFFSGCLIDPSGIVGFVEAYAVWTHTGTGGESGHEKEWFYWLVPNANNDGGLMLRYEWPVLFGVAASFGVVLPKTRRFLRWLAIGAVGTLVAYSIVRYKTPWCLIAFAWPFFLVFGAGVEWLMERVDRWTISVMAGLVCFFSFNEAKTLNFKKFADETEPYVYVQTTLDLNKLLDPLHWELTRDPNARYRIGHVIQNDKYPLLWLLGDWPNVTWGDHDAAPQPLDAEWLLVDPLSQDRIEGELKDTYFRERIHIRGMAPDDTWLYLRAATFADYFPGRTPEFQAGPRVWKIEPSAPAAPTTPNP